MKKLLHLLIVAIIAFSLAACDSPESANPETDNPENDTQQTTQITDDNGDNNLSTTTSRKDYVTHINSISQIDNSSWYYSKTFTGNELQTFGLSDCASALTVYYYFSFLEDDNSEQDDNITTQYSYVIDFNNNVLQNTRDEKTWALDENFFKVVYYKWEANNNTIIFKNSSNNSYDGIPIPSSAVIDNYTLKVTYNSENASASYLGTGNSNVTINCNQCYGLYYDALQLGEGALEELKNNIKYYYANFSENIDYTVTGLTIEFTELGITRYLDAILGIGYYLTVPNDKLYILIDDGKFSYYFADSWITRYGLTKDRDYKISHNGHVFELTASGKDKVQNSSFTFNFCYDDITFDDSITEYELRAFCENYDITLLVNINCTFDGTKLEFNDTGITDFLNSALKLCHSSSDLNYANVTKCYLLCYNKEFLDCICDIDLEDDYEDGDYSITHNNNVVELTDTGYQKFEVQHQS